MNNSSLIFDHIEISGFMSFPPHKMQKLILNTHRLTTIIGENLDVGDGERNGVGKAQPLTAKILAPTGWTTMGDLAPGDLVVTPDGYTASVNSIHPQGNIPVFRIDFIDGRSTEACADHLWKVWGKWGGNWSWKIKTTAEIVTQTRRGGFAKNVFVPLVEPRDDVPIELSIDPYLLGVLLGDGTITKSRTAITTTDPQIVHECLPLIPDSQHFSVNGITLSIVSQERVSKNSPPAPKGSNRLRHLLRELGLINSDSYNKFIPKIYKHASIEQKLSLLQGLMDTDGEVTKTGSLIFSTSSQMLAKDVQEIVWSIGGICKITPSTKKYTYKGQTYTGAISYRLNIRYRSPKSLVRLNRKKERLSSNYQYANTLRLRISSITPIGEKPSQCIVIDHPDQLYITDDWIVTHNSAIIDAILYLYFGRSPRMPNQDLLNYIEPGPMFVSGTASRAGIAFKVERGDNPSVLRLYEKPIDDSRDFRTKDNGKLIFETTKSTKPETTKRVSELLGFDLKLTDVLLVNNPSDRSCFFLKTEEEQRNIVERIFGFTVFTEKANLIRELRKEEIKNLNTKESALIATKQANDRVLTQITAVEEKSNAWAVERDKVAKFLAQQINTYKGIDFDHEFPVLVQYEELVSQMARSEHEQRTHEESLGALKQQHRAWEETHTMLIENLTKIIEERRHIDAAAEIETIRLRLQIETDIRGLLAEVEAAQRERDPYRQALEAQHTQKSRLAKQINITEQKIIQLNESKCPTCGQDWADTKGHIRECIDELDGQTHENSKLDTSINDLKTKIKRIEQQVDKLNMRLNGLTPKLAGLPNTSFQSVEEAAKASNSLNEQILKLKEVEEHTNPHTNLMEAVIAKIAACNARREALRDAMITLPKTHYEELHLAVAHKRDFEEKLAQFAELQQTDNPHRETIDNLRKHALKPVDETEIRELRRRIDHMSMLITLLADRDSPIRKSILQEWLPELNNRVNGYLESLELPQRVIFDANMTATFNVKGKTLGGFGNLSAGQRLRVWLATNLAFREIFELINYPINLFFIDEVLDKGMSARGAEVSYRLLEQMANQGRSLFLITHRQELVDMSSDTMTITLENGLSEFHQSEPVPVLYGSVPA